MALRPCSECGNQVSTRATSCPKCGNPLVAEKLPAYVEPPTIRRAQVSPAEMPTRIHHAPPAPKKPIVTALNLTLAIGIAAVVAIGIGRLGEGNIAPRRDRPNVTATTAAEPTPDPTPAPPRAPDPTPPPKPKPIAVDNLKLWADYESNEVAADQLYKDKRLEVTGLVRGIRKDFTGSIVVEIASRNPFMSSMATMESTTDTRFAKLAKGNKVVVDCDGGGRIMGMPMLSNCELISAFQRGPATEE